MDPLFRWRSIRLYGLVNLVVELEELIQDDYGITITLADEKAMSRRTSPFSRVKYLIDYIKEKLNTNSNE